MTEPKKVKNEEEKETLVKCDIKDGKEITQEECEYLNQKAKAMEKGRSKQAEEFMAKDASSKICNDCDSIAPFDKA